MPAGCDFVCENEKCEYCKMKIQINGPWPIAKINTVINSQKIKGTSHEEELKKRQSEGIKYACVAFPHMDKFNYNGVKLEKFCPKCLKKFSEYVVFFAPVSPKKLDRVFRKRVRESKFIKMCPDCGTRLLDLQRAMKEGIICPKCKVETKQNRWFC